LDDIGEKIRERICEEDEGFVEGARVLSYHTLCERLRDVFKGRVKAAFLFGGRVKGYTLKGDYDIAVYFGRSHSSYDLGELAVDVARALNIGEEEVDLDSAAPEIRLEALQGKPLYVEDDYVLFELKVRSILELLDMRSGMRPLEGLA